MNTENPNMQNAQNPQANGNMQTAAGNPNFQYPNQGYPQQGQYNYQNGSNPAYNQAPQQPSYQEAERIKREQEEREAKAKEQEEADKARKQQELQVLADRAVAQSFEKASQQKTTAEKLEDIRNSSNFVKNIQFSKDVTTPEEAQKVVDDLEFQASSAVSNKLKGTTHDISPEEIREGMNAYLNENIPVSKVYATALNMLARKLGDKGRDISPDGNLYLLKRASAKRVDLPSECYTELNKMLPKTIGGENFTINSLDDLALMGLSHDRPEQAAQRYFKNDPAKTGQMTASQRRHHNVFRRLKTNSDLANKVRVAK